MNALKFAEAYNVELRHKAKFKRLVDEYGAEYVLAKDHYHLQPTPYFFEGVAYYHRARLLQDANLGLIAPGTKCGDPLQDAIPIYDTVERRYAGFSNLLEQLWYGKQAPKYAANALRTFDCDQQIGRRVTLETWLAICLTHRVTGSGASFEWDHGFRNAATLQVVKELHAKHSGNLAPAHIGAAMGAARGPIFTSIGNQIPPFNKLVRADKYRTAGQEYLATAMPKIADQMAYWLDHQPKPVGIKTATEKLLELQRDLDYKQFKFVMTATAMDLAEYCPDLVDPWSDVYHGKNAVEAMELCFDKTKFSGNRQAFYDQATRCFSTITGTKPMDVEDASPGCDLIRWVENYVPKKGFDHVIANRLYNTCSIRHNKGRQPEDDAS